jgi:serine/threonine-protein kinase RsbW
MKAENKQTGINREELIISSDFANLPKVEQFTVALCKKAHLDNDQSDNMAIAITELVNNAIIHAHKQDPTKKVVVRVRYEKDRVVVAIIDEGPGFDPREVANPTDPQNLWKQNGRGIFLVRNLIDSVVINSSPKGTEVVLTEYVHEN